MQFYHEVWQTMVLVVIIYLLPLIQLLKFLFNFLYQGECDLCDNCNIFFFIFSFNISMEQ